MYESSLSLCLYPILLPFQFSNKDDGKDVGGYFPVQSRNISGMYTYWCTTADGADVANSAMSADEIESTFTESINESVIPEEVLQKCQNLR